MRAILINTQTRTVKEVEYNGELEQAYSLLNCRMVEPVYIEKEDCIYVDEEGLYSVDDNSVFFTYKGAHQPFCGNGLVVGSDLETGATVGSKNTVEEIRARVDFLSAHQVRSQC